MEKSTAFVALFISLFLSSFIIAGFITDYETFNKISLTNSSSIPIPPQSFNSTSIQICGFGDFICGINNFFSTLTSIFGVWGTMLTVIAWGLPEQYLPAWANLMFIKSQVTALIFLFFIIIRG